MKKIILIVMLIGIIILATGCSNNNSQISEQNGMVYIPETIITEDIIKETIIHENIITEKTWENSVTYWD